MRKQFNEQVIKYFEKEIKREKASKRVKTNRCKDKRQKPKDKSLKANVKVRVNS